MIEDAGISVREIGRSDEVVWNELLRTAVDGSYRQSMEFEYARAFEGWQIHSFVFYRGGKPIAGVHYALRQSPWGMGPVADASSGFVHKDEPEPDLYQRLVEHFVDWAGERNSSLIRLATWLPKSVGGHLTPYSSWVPRMMKVMGFKVFRPGRHTYWIDLTQDEDVLLSKMKKQTRYNIRKACRGGVRIEFHERACPELFETFFSLYDSRARQKRLRDRFDYERAKLELIPTIESGLGFLCFARLGDWVCNVIFASNFGQAASIHSGIDPRVQTDGIRLSPGRLSRWELIRYLKHRGLKIHDMGFCPGPVPVSGHPLYGIWSFKYGFGGDHVEFLPTYYRALKRGRGYLLSFALKLRRHLVGI